MIKFDHKQARRPWSRPYRNSYSGSKKSKCLPLSCRSLSIWMCVPGTITNLIPRPWSNAISCNTIWVMCWTFLRQHYDRPQAQKTQFEITPPQSKLKHRERRWTISKSMKKTNTHLMSSCSSHWLQKWAWLNQARQLDSVATIFQAGNSWHCNKKV